MYQIIIPPDVEAELSASQIAQLRNGDLTGPNYECLRCREPGDLRTEKSSPVLLTTDSSMTLVWVHTTCHPGGVIPHAHLATVFGRPEDTEPGTSRSSVPDTTGTTMVQLNGVIYPAVVITPGDNIRMVLPGTTAVRDLAVEALRAEGFDDVDLSGARRPAELPEWTIRVDRGRLTRITKPGETWWASQDQPQLDAEWRTAAKQTRHALLMIVGTEMPEQRLADFQAAMLAAASTGRLVGALVKIIGTMS